MRDNVFICAVVLLVLTLFTLQYWMYPATGPSDYVAFYIFAFYMSLAVLVSKGLTAASPLEYLCAYMVLLVLSTPLTALATALLGPGWRWRIFLKIGFLAPAALALVMLIGGEPFLTVNTLMIYVVTPLAGAVVLRCWRAHLDAASYEDGTH